MKQYDVQSAGRRRSWLAATLTGAAAVLSAAPAVGQAGGVPLWSVAIPPSSAYRGALFLAGHTTSGDDAFGETNAERGVTLAGRWTFVDVFTVTAGGGFATRDVSLTARSEQAHYFASVAWTPLTWMHPVQPIEAAFSPVVGGGVGALPGPGDERNLTAGADLSLSFGGGGWFIEPSVQPRWHWRRTPLAAERITQNGFGTTVSVAFNWTRWSLAVAGDYVDLGAADALPATPVWAGSIGLQYAVGPKD